jgi:hypothetical protein
MSTEAEEFSVERKRSHTVDFHERQDKFSHLKRMFHCIQQFGLQFHENARLEPVCQVNNSVDLQTLLCVVFKRLKPQIE